MVQLLSRLRPGGGVSTGDRASGAAVQSGSPSPIELLVVQPTPFCNLDCSYCYLPDRDNRRRMSAETLHRLCERLRDSTLLGETLSIVWHAGEPLVLPPDYYDAAFDILEAQLGGRSDIRHCFQTNATLIDDAWIDFVRRRRVSVGVSLDGPAWLHDRHRKTRSGAGSFARTLRGVKRLQDAGIPFHVIAVLTAPAGDCAAEIFEFFTGEGVCHIGFNVEEIEADNLQSSLEAGDAGVKVQAFFARLIELNRAAGNPLRIREVAGMVGAILGECPGPRGGQETTALKILSVGVDGALSAFSPELLGATQPGYGNFVFGNVWTDSLADMLAAPKFRRVAAEIAAGVARCEASCGYFELCGGGAASNKLFEHGSFDATETLYCRLTKKAVADAVMAALEEDLPLYMASGQGARCP